MSHIETQGWKQAMSIDRLEQQAPSKEVPLIFNDRSGYRVSRNSDKRVPNYF